MKTALICLLLSVAPLAAVAQAPAGLTGDWTGEIDVTAYGSGKIGMILHAGPPATLDVPSQGATARPVELKVDGSKVTFAITGVEASYEGALSDDKRTVKGEFTQNGIKLPLVFARKP
jgi:hypothetical protein